MQIFGGHLSIQLEKLNDLHYFLDIKVKLRKLDIGENELIRKCYSFFV